MTDDLFPGIAIHTDLVDEFDARSAAMAERRMEAVSGRPTPTAYEG